MSQKKSAASRRTEDEYAFRAFSRNGEKCSLVLWRKKGAAAEEIPMARISPDCFSVCVSGLRPSKKGIEYGFRMSGRMQPSEGHRFDDSIVLSDPYARCFSASGRSLLLGPEAFDFDWKGDTSPKIPDEDLVIYEVNVHNFTASPSSNVNKPGTFNALAQKIPYLKDLGVNCVELMPIAEFDSAHNVWGYNSIGFFAPKASYGTPLEFKSLVRQLHRAGIEVVLDIVFNHSPESDETGPTINYRGLDNKSYYMLEKDGKYANYSGCHNTLDCSGDLMKSLILDCLRYWVSEYHVDGFRFDLAAVFNRESDGSSSDCSSLVRSISSCPELSGIRLIAEPWDACGLYQLGAFSRVKDGKGMTRWSEWNDRFRDTMRRLVKSDGGQMQEAVLRMDGSRDIFPPDALPVNFITAHDGFTLKDLVSYNFKHNDANGEGGRDGSDNNLSWNCGVEGPCDPDSQTGSLRVRQMKNFLTLLLLSRGIPMITGGDEMGHTQYGNNNPYCIDDKSIWLDWDDLGRNAELYRFTKSLISIRHSTPAFRHGIQSSEIKSDHLMKVRWEGSVPKESFLLVVNTHWEARVVPIDRNSRWSVCLNTGMPSPEDIFLPGDEPALADSAEILVGPRSMMLLVRR